MLKKLVPVKGAVEEIIKKAERRECVNYVRMNKNTYTKNVDNRKSTSSGDFGGRYKMTFDGEKIESYNEIYKFKIFNKLYSDTLIK